MDQAQITQPDATPPTTTLAPPPLPPPGVGTLPPAPPSAPKRSISDRLGGRRRILTVVGVIVLVVGALAAGTGIGSATTQDKADRQVADAKQAAAVRVQDARHEASVVGAQRDEARQRATAADDARNTADERAKARMEARLKAARAADAARLKAARAKDAQGVQQRKAAQDAAAKTRSAGLDTRQGQLDQRQKDLDAKSGAISAREAAVTQQEAQTVGDGLYEVGKDMAPGKYHSNGSGCYYTLLSAPSGSGVDNIIDNNNVDGPATIIVNSPYFESNGCGTWQKVG